MNGCFTGHVWAETRPAICLYDLIFPINNLKKFDLNLKLLTTTPLTLMKIFTILFLFFNNLIQIGDIVTVTRRNVSGQWEGSINDRHGYFPFTHVRIVDASEIQEQDAINFQRLSHISQNSVEILLENPNDDGSYNEVTLKRRK